MTSFRTALSRAIPLTFAAISQVALAYDWLQFNGDPQHSGNNTRESIVHRNNVGRLLMQWQATLPVYADGAPVILEAVSTPSGIKDLVFLTTTAGHIVAVDAATGATVWSHANGPGTCKINNGGNTCFTTSSPAIDPNRQFVYSYGLDGTVHKYAVGDGTEIITQGWPQLTTLKGFDEKNASALSFAIVGGTTYLYSVNGGYPGDAGDYQGHVTTIDLGSGTQKVFNILCSNQTVHLARMPATPNCGTARSAVWARGGVTYHAGTNRVFMSTGNGNFNGDTGGFNWGDSIVAMNPNGTNSGTGKPLDAYTPTNQLSLEAADADLGSTGPVVLPTPAGSNYAHIGMQGGKDGKLRLVNLANLNGSGAPGPLGGEIGSIVNIPQGNVLLAQPATWINHADGSTWTFVVNSSGASALRVDLIGGNPTLSTRWQSGTSGASPLVANNLVYYAGGNAVRAVDPLTGATAWSNPRIGGTHWQSPVVANGAVYVQDSAGHLTAFRNAGSSLLVDVRPSGGASNTNGMLEPGESVVVEPGWRNITGASLSLSGTASALTGPAGPTYTINDSTAGYGTIAASAAADCFTASGNCYRITVSNPATRPAQHWDAALRETLSNGDTATLLLHIGASFSDVPATDIMYRFVEGLVHNSVTTGYADGTYQPAANSIRGATAIFVARAGVAPNGDGGLARSGTVAGQPYNCVAGGTSLFADVAPTDNFCKHVHALAAKGVNVSFGCVDATHTCPNASTNRGVVAVSVAGAIAGSDVAVPAAATLFDTGSPRVYNCNAGGDSHFPDVLPTDANCRHVNYLWARGMIDGFVDGTFRSAISVTRGQMAKFLTNGFRLAIYE